jgi:ribosomal protein S8E
MTQPDINTVINELTLQVANLVRENAILKATIATIQAKQKAPVTDGGELESA